MYVCLCNGFTCGQVRTVVKDGAKTPGRVYAHLGCKMRCGKCLPMVRDLVSESADTELEPMAMAAE